jgi:tRNA (adenine57-N1/adenine58-N1)-methyltransferase
MRMGEVSNLAVRLRPVEEGLAEEEPVDRAVFDLPEPWHLVEPVTRVLRSGGVFLSYLPTIIQSHQLSEALRRHPGYSLVETFETLMRPWNIDGLSVRPFHRMVAHTGFLTVARRVVPEEGGAQPHVEHPEGH